MRYFLCFLVLVGLVPLGPRAAWAQVGNAQPDVKSDLAANAALQYWQAFAQLPTLDKDQEKILSEWNAVSLDDPAVQKLIAASQSSLMYLHRGAALSRCDWGLDYGDGISMLMPQLAKARDLARLAALHARSEFERGNKRGARDDATAMMILARHVGREPVMICVLVRQLIEGLVVDLVASYVPDLKVPHAQAAQMFSDLPPAPNVLQTIPIEKKFFVQWMVTKLKEEEQQQKGAGLKLWKNFLSGADVPDSIKEVATVDEAVKHIADVLPLYDEMARLVALPKTQFDAEYPAFKQKAKAEHPLAATVLPSVDQLLAKEQRGQVRMAMLLAAIAVVESGPEKLKDLKDPFGDGPFEYKALDKGFELKSKLLFEDKPVTLVIGQRAK